MLVRIRYVALTDGGLINGQVYPVLGWNLDKPIVLDSNNVINPTGRPINDPASWQLVSVEVTRVTELLYP